MQTSAQHRQTSTTTKRETTQPRNKSGEVKHRKSNREDEIGRERKKCGGSVGQRRNTQEETRTINQKTRKAKLNKQRQAKTRDLKFQHRTGFNKFCNRVYINQSTPQPNEPHRAGPRQNKRITQQFKQYDFSQMQIDKVASIKDSSITKVF